MPSDEKTKRQVFWWVALAIVTTVTLFYVFGAIREFIPEGLERPSPPLHWRQLGFLTGIACWVHYRGMWLMALLAFLNISAVWICWRAARGLGTGIWIPAYISLFLLGVAMLVFSDLRLHSVGTIEIAPDISRNFRGEDAFVLTAVAMQMALPAWLLIARQVWERTRHRGTEAFG